MQKQNQKFLATFFSIWIIGGSIWGHSYFFPKVSAKNITERTEQSLKILQFNLLLENHNYTETIKNILSVDADILFLEEIDQDWGKKLEEKLSKKYPYFISKPDDYAGLALYSKFPLIDSEIFHYKPINLVKAKIKINQKTLQLYGIHATNPMNQDLMNMRNSQIDYLADYILGQQTKNSSKNAILIAGDFNAVSNSKILRKFKEKTQLNIATNPLLFSYSKAGIGVGIDHLFFSDNFNFYKSFIKKSEYSDHDMLIGEFGI